MSAPPWAYMQEPKWVQLDPTWRQEILDYSTRNNTDILAWLQLHGRRWKTLNFNDRIGHLYPQDQPFFEDQPEAEEGFALENEVHSVRPPMTASLSTNISHLAQ